MLDEIVKSIISNPLSVDFPGRTHYCGEIDDHIYRVILDKESCDLYRRIFEDPAWMIRLFELGLIKTTLLGEDSEGHLVLEHENLRFRSMFHEWTFSQRKDAAIAIMRLQEVLYEKDCYLSDPHVFNITFSGATPIYYDFGSIVPGHYPLPEWIRNFWLSQTWPASWLAHLQISYPELQDLLSHPSLETLQEQIERISYLESTMKKSEWSSYDKHDFNAADPTTWKEKHKAVKELLHCLPKIPKEALDVGANTGDFGKLLLESGVERVCGLDVDERAVEEMYQTAKAQHLNLYPAVADLFSLFGWHAIDFGDSGWERQWRPIRRFSAELVLAIALVHHLSYFRDVPMERVAQVLSAFTKKYLIIEWIPYTDKHLEGPINRHNRDRSSYTEENFVRIFQKHFPNVISRKDSTDDRKMYLFSKEL